MPLYDEEENSQNIPADAVLPEEQTLHTNDELKTSLLFESEFPLDNIIREIGGQRWGVTYFRQDIDVYEEPKQIDIGLEVALQQYQRINHMLLYLQSALDTTDPNNITGNALVNVGMRVFKFDVFLATLPGGRLGIFEITNVTTKRYNSKEVYDIDIKLNSFADTATALYDNLIAKVNKIYVYDDTYLATYGSPIILQSEYYTKQDLINSRLALIDYYLNTFFDKETSLLLEPTSDGIKAYDSYLTSFFLTMVNTSDNELLYTINKSNYEKNIDRTIYDIVMSKNIKLLKYVNTDIGYIQPSIDYDTPILRTLSFLGVNYVMNDPGDLIPATLTYKPTYDPDVFTDPISIVAEYKIPFSSFFYTGDLVNMGILEANVYNFMENKLTPLDDLITMISEYRNWDYREQFRLLPFLLLLVTNKINNTFSET